MHESRETVSKAITARYDHIITDNDEEEESKQELIRCEVNIACGRNGYYAIGDNFRRIRDSKAYRIAGYKNFGIYTKEAHKRTKSSVYRLINIADLHDRLVPIVGEENMPYTAHVLGSMLGLEPDQEVQVYELALEKAKDNGEMVEAADIKAAKDELGLSKPKLSAAPSTKEPEHEEDAVPVNLLAASAAEDNESDEDDADEDPDEDDASESDDVEMNSVNLALARDKLFRARAVKARAAARAEKSKILDKTDRDKLFRARRVKARAALRAEKSKFLDAMDEDSQEASAEETAIELGERMKKLGEEDIITQEVITPLLMGNKHVIMAYLDRATGSKYKRRLKDLLPCIDEVLTGKPREQDEDE